MRRQFIEMILLNVRIDAIDSGCTYQVISEAQMCMCWAFGGGVVREFVESSDLELRNILAVGMR